MFVPLIDSLIRGIKRIEKMRSLRLIAHRFHMRGLLIFIALGTPF